MENRGKTRGRSKESGIQTRQPSSQQLLERYSDHLEGEGLSEDQAKEFLGALWQIMVAFVDLGFSVKAGDKFSPKSDISMDDVLQYLCLEDTAPETVASLKTDKQKEPR